MTYNGKAEIARGALNDAAGRALDVLRCPVTGERLIVRSGWLCTATGTRRYPIAAGVPVLLAAGRSLFDATTVAVHCEPPIRRRVRARLRAALTASSASRRNVRRLIELLNGDGTGGTGARRVLVVGGGILGFGAGELLGCPSIDLIETDVYIGPRTAIVCDAHDLPFADGSFDAVVIQAVLEHVIDPVRVASELHRVLAPQGLLYSEVPFMQQVHEGAYDFTRWTMTGHRRLLHEFDEIAAGPVGGPGEALAWSLRSFAVALAGDHPRARRLLGSLLTLLTLPLRLVDLLIGDTPAALDAAGGTFLLGRRREGARPDAEIIAAHVGTMSEPQR